jgi:hypothetical protein
MLTTQSYLLALFFYVVAGTLGVWLLSRLLLRGVAVVTRGILIGVLAALVLTPAFPNAESATLAPALIVMVFNAAFVAEGMPYAQRALGLLSLSALVMGTLGGILSARWARARGPLISPERSADPDGHYPTDDTFTNREAL